MSREICRSAVAERLLRLRLIGHLGVDADLFEVSSAGVQGITGERMDADSAAARRDLGGDESSFIAWRLDGGQIKAADLLLTANRKHRPRSYGSTRARLAGRSPSGRS